MIEIDFYSAISIFLSVFLLASFFYFIFTDGAKRKNTSLDARYLWHCSVCLHAYFDARRSSFSHCPKCGSINKKDINGKAGKDAL
ncbi:MAG: hypothetical protein COV72_07030 [Candidatus Omnitrophica bacterium CG11_big_fil_rev_8_21_14_0_20_42_13]|uniref:Hydrogenase nickel incorporation protein HypA n=1 Tax=Candidatus Ghiorseimicrobium undicola TaxID=1974746 RepID=A0A2H0LYC4_9BACT|nr:MAG: hypothetical protein COV72_07030 [Candidatus Omnitrophica bacterium CG11_big_fil_rev_8_21_14_0_20_42_13]